MGKENQAKSVAPRKSPRGKNYFLKESARIKLSTNINKPNIQNKLTIHEKLGFLKTNVNKKYQGNSLISSDIDFTHEDNRHYLTASEQFDLLLLENKDDWRSCNNTLFEAKENTFSFQNNGSTRCSPAKSLNEVWNSNLTNVNNRIKKTKVSDNHLKRKGHVLLRNNDNADIINYNIGISRNTRNTTTVIDEHLKSKNDTLSNNNETAGIADLVKQPFDFKTLEKMHNPIGCLVNIGNSCYVNSVIYTLSFTPTFLHRLHHHFEHMHQFVTEQACYATIKLHNIYKILHHNDVVQKSHIHEFIRSVQKMNPIFLDNAQQDAHELLLCILNFLQESFFISCETVDMLSDQDDNLDKVWENSDMNSFMNISFIDKLFKGVAIYNTECINCKHQTRNKQTMMDITLEVSALSLENNNNHISGNKFFQQICLAKTLNECRICKLPDVVEHFTKYETLPKILIFQLKRFTTNLSKIMDKSLTPIEFDCFCNNCTDLNNVLMHKYSLFAVIMHKGCNMTSGHYVTYTKDNNFPSDFNKCSFRSGSASLDGNSECSAATCCTINYKNKVTTPSTWYYCDDDKIKTLTSVEFYNYLNSNSVSNTTPYILFYTKFNVQ